MAELMLAGQPATPGRLQQVRKQAEAVRDLMALITPHRHRRGVHCHGHWGAAQIRARGFFPLLSFLSFFEPGCVPWLVSSDAGDEQAPTYSL
ncbi:MAG: hypothetical protein Q4F13_12105 [Pseudomonadota bacterium]|nr:hypothetical protein [Pseudomonadota bacterium]